MAQNSDVFWSIGLWVHSNLLFFETIMAGYRVLRTKSEQNVKSAELLISQNFHSASVHCSYYSCVQLILDILRYDFNITEGDLDIEYKFWRKQQSAEDEVGRHNYYLNTIVLKLYELCRASEDDEEVDKINSLFSAIKVKRVQADYKESLIGPNESNKVLAKAQQINALLNGFTNLSART